MKSLLKNTGERNGSLRFSWAAIMSGNLVFFVLIFVGSPAVAGQLFFPFGDVFGPNESVEVWVHVGFVTDCPPLGTDDGWPHSIYPVADIYVLRDGTISGNSRAKLTDVVGTPNTVIGAASIFPEIVAYTQPGGALGSGKYDLVLDECQDGYYDPGVDFMLGMGDAAAFTVVIPSVIPNLHAGTAISDAKNAAETESQRWSNARGYFGATFLAVKAFSIGMQLISYGPWVTGIIYVIGEMDPYQQLLSQAQGMIGNLCSQMAAHWNGIAEDPPDPDFTELIEMGEVELLYPVMGSGLEPAIVYFINDATEQAAILPALLAAMEKYQGAREADNADFALLQAGQIKKYSDLLVTKLGEVNASHADLIQELQNTGIDFTAFATDLLDMQDRVSIEGWTAQELFQMYNLGLTDSVIDQATQNFLNDDFTPLQLGDLYVVLQELHDANVAAITNFSGLSLAADEVIDSLAQLVELTAPVADPNGPYTGDEGAPIQFDGSGSYDPNGDPITFAWELNGDGLFDDGSSTTPQIYLRRRAFSIGWPKGD